MKKILGAIFISLFVFVLFACKPAIKEKDGISVTFDTNGGSAVEELILTEPALINAPIFPKKSNSKFLGWYNDQELTDIFDFTNQYVTGKKTLYAKWGEALTDYKQTFKVLSIGNSFSDDAHKYLWEIAESYGVKTDNIIIANMYIGGAELEKQVNNMTKDLAIYDYRVFKSPKENTQTSYKLSKAIADEDWDVITFQQASHDSGVSSKYENYLNTMVDWAKEKATNPDVIIGWHMTWAYQGNSNHSGFNNYEKDQMVMYTSIVDVLYEKVFTTENMSFLIPSGTAIQNARTSYVGDTLTLDGYHLSQPFGRYIAGLSFFKAITGFDISNIAYSPAGVTPELKAIAIESVNNAINTPLKVTNSKNTTAPIVPEPEPGEEIPVNGVELSFEYQLGFWNANATSISKENDGLHNKFIAVSPIHKSLLPVGSEIVLKEGFQYRIILMEKIETGFKVIKRTDNFKENYLVVTEDTFDNADYIAFNISYIGNQVVLTDIIEETILNFKLYNPETVELVNVIQDQNVIFVDNKKNKK